MKIAVKNILFFIASLLRGTDEDLLSEIAQYDCPTLRL